MKRFLIAVAIATSWAMLANAQQTRTRPSPTGFALEVTYFEGRKPAYEQVQRIKLPKGQGSWFGLFGHVRGWQLPAGAPAVGAVRVVPYLDGDAVSVSFSVLRGEFLDVEDVVGTVTLRENEMTSVEALRDFGVEPFKIKLIRVSPQPSEVPTVINQTKMIEVVGIEAVVSTFPCYKLTLHNLSDKDINALRIYVMRDGKVGLSSTKQGDNGEPLVKAGSFGEVREILPTRAESTAAGYSPAAPGAHQIVIASVIFEDGTYEGEAASAANYRGFVVGNRTELSRILPILDNALATLASKEATRAQLSQLPYTFEKGEVAALVTKFPGVDRAELKASVEVAIHLLRKEVLDELDRAATGDFRACLERMRDRYSLWLERLNPGIASR
jgi:hypothetical protein